MDVAVDVGGLVIEGLLATAGGERVAWGSRCRRSEITVGGDEREKRGEGGEDGCRILHFDDSSRVSWC